jgi:hypothetical protein
VRLTSFRSWSTIRVRSSSCSASAGVRQMGRMHATHQEPHIADADSCLCRSNRRRLPTRHGGPRKNTVVKLRLINKSPVPSPPLAPSATPIGPPKQTAPPPRLAVHAAHDASRQHQSLNPRVLPCWPRLKIQDEQRASSIDCLMWSCSRSWLSFPAPIPIGQSTAS